MLENDFYPAIRRGDLETVWSMVAQQPHLLESRHASGVSPVLFALYHEQPRLALFLARRQKQLDVCELSALGMAGKLRRRLMQERSLVGQVAPDGTPALGLAARFGRLAACRVLLRQGAEINRPAENELAYTPLHQAVLGRSLVVMRYLLAQGADPNLGDAEWHTPLHLAAAKGYREGVRALLRHRADARRRTRSGMTAVQLAQARGHGETASLLRRAAAPQK